MPALCHRDDADARTGAGGRNEPVMEEDQIQAGGLKGRYTHCRYVRAMETAKVKDEAKRLVEDLPEDASWDDLMYKIYVRQAIEAGLSDSEAGRTTDVKDVRARLGLMP